MSAELLTKGRYVYDFPQQKPPIQIGEHLFFKHYYLGEALGGQHANGDIYTHKLEEEPLDIRVRRELVKDTGLETDTHFFFYTNEFSNWYPCRFNHPTLGHAFSDSEAAFMWLKADFFGDEEAADAMLMAKHPAEVKALGRKVKGFNEEAWEGAREYLMVLANFWKFTAPHHTRIKQLLLDTGDKILVEASKTDLIWGVGLAQDDPKIQKENEWRGLNLLGKALMEVRDLIK